MCAYIYCSHSACLSGRAPLRTLAGQAGVRIPYSRRSPRLHPSPVRSPKVFSLHPAAPAALVPRAASRRRDLLRLLPCSVTQSMPSMPTSQSNSRFPPPDLKLRSYTRTACCIALASSRRHRFLWVWLCVSGLLFRPRAPAPAATAPSPAPCCRLSCASHRSPLGLATPGACTTPDAPPSPGALGSPLPWPFVLSPSPCL